MNLFDHRAFAAKKPADPQRRGGARNSCAAAISADGFGRRTASRPPFNVLCRARAMRNRCARVRQPAALERDEALKVFLQNLLDSLLIAFMWGIGRCWSVRVD